MFEVLFCNVKYCIQFYQCLRRNLTHVTTSANKSLVWSTIYFLIFRTQNRPFYKVNRFINLQYCLKHNILQTSLLTLSPQMSNTEFRSTWSSPYQHLKNNDGMTKPENPPKEGISKWMPCLQPTSFIKQSSGETEYIEHFPNHFPQGPRPCHMLGGCRSSLEGSEQRDGWHPLVDTVWHLIFLSWVVFFFPFWEGCYCWDSSILKANKCGVCIASEKCCRLTKAWVWVGGKWRGLKRESHLSFKEIYR